MVAQKERFYKNQVLRPHKVLCAFLSFVERGLITMRDLIANIVVLCVCTAAWGVFGACLFIAVFWL